MSYIDSFLTNFRSEDGTELSEITKIATKAPASAGLPIVNMFLRKHFEGLKVEDLVYSEDKTEIKRILEDDYQFEVDDNLLSKLVSIFKVNDEIFVIRSNRVN